MCRVRSDAQASPDLFINLTERVEYHVGDGETRVVTRRGLWDGDALHPRGLRREHAVEGVFDREAGRRARAEPPSRRQVDAGVGLAVLLLLGRVDAVELVREPEALGDGADEPVGRRRGERDLNIAGAEEVERVTDAL